VEWGEVVKAILVPTKGKTIDPAELTAYVKERLASYKAPQYYAVVSDLPLNPMGKVLKTELRKTHGQPQNDM
jgi:acyl-CoA synthetase (AMP-forming)/AMP-acid ligase II